MHIYVCAYLCALKYAEPLVTLLPWSTVHILDHKWYRDDTLVSRGVVFINVDKSFCPHI